MRWLVALLLVAGCAGTGTPGLAQELGYVAADIREVTPILDDRELAADLERLAHAAELLGAALESGEGDAVQVAVDLTRGVLNEIAQRDDLEDDEVLLLAAVRAVLRRVEGG